MTTIPPFPLSLCAFRFCRRRRRSADIQAHQHALDVREISDNLAQRRGNASHQRGNGQNLVALRQAADVSPGRLPRSGTPASSARRKCVLGLPEPPAIWESARPHKAAIQESLPPPRIRWRTYPLPFSLSSSSLGSISDPFALFSTLMPRLAGCPPSLAYPAPIDAPRSAPAESTSPSGSLPPRIPLSSSRCAPRVLAAWPAIHLACARWSAFAAAPRPNPWLPAPAAPNP